MPVYNGYKFTTFSNLNAKDGIFRFGSVLSSALDDSSTMAIYTRGTSLYFWNGTSETEIGAAGSGGVTTWDSMYDLDKSMTIDDDTFTLAGNHASNDVLTITNATSKTGDCVKIQNSGTGKDLSGTSDTWSFTKAGILDCTGITIGDDETLVFGDGSDITIQYDENGNDNLQITGAVNFDNAVSLDSTLSVAGDVTLSDSSITLTDADDAASVVITNASCVSGNLVTVTGDAVEDGSLLYLDNGGASLSTGFYINCNDDGTSDFTVGADGATAITTTLNSTLALSVTGIQTSENLVEFDNTSGVIASDQCVLLLDAGGAIASGGNILRIAPTGTPNAGAIGIEYVGAGKTNMALYIDSDPTGTHVAQIHGGGALTDGKAVLALTNDGNLATGGNLLNITVGGTPNAGAIALEIAAAGKTLTGLSIDADPTASNVALINGGGALTNGYAVLQLTNDGNLATGGALEIITMGGTPNADARALEIDAQKDARAVYIDSDAATNHAVEITGAGDLAEDKAMLSVTSTATALVAGSSLVRIADSGSAAGAGATVYGLEIAMDGTNLEGLNVSAGTSIFAEAVTFTAGSQNSSVARTATETGATTGTIAAGTSFVTVTVTNADHIVVLPPPVVGNVIWINNPGTTGFELRTSAPQTIAINGGTQTDAESAIAAATLVRMVCTSSTTWIGSQFTAAGTESPVEVAAT